jgi:hypothetical protein
LATCSSFVVRELIPVLEALDSDGRRVMIKLIWAALCLSRPAAENIFAYMFINLPHSLHAVKSQLEGNLLLAFRFGMIWDMRSTATCNRLPVIICQRGDFAFCSGAGTDEAPTDTQPSAGFHSAKLSGSPRP